MRARQIFVFTQDDRTHRTEIFHEIFTKILGNIQAQTTEKIQQTASNVAVPLTGEKGTLKQAIYKRECEYAQYQCISF